MPRPARRLFGPLTTAPSPVRERTTTDLSRRERPLSLAGVVLIALWILALYDPHWLLAAHGPNVVLKAPVLLLPILAVALLVEVPTSPALSRRWQWYAPLLCLVVVGAITLPVALNNGYVRESLQRWLLFWTLIVGTVALVDSPRRAEALLLLYGLSFLWWGLWGGRRGLVPWHHSLSNPDGYGATMVGGVGMCTALALSAGKSRFRNAMAVAAALSVVGVVSSFARGAFLGAVAIFALVWLRSPHKGRVFAAGLLAAVVMVTAANILHPGRFWAEIQSTFTQGTSEGTGEDRWELWKAGWRVFLQRPVFGVGPRNFGPFAVQFFQPGDIGGMYALNPGILYNRSLHNVYVELLCETGVVGLSVFFWMLAGFWRRNAELRTAEAQARWQALGGRLRLKTVALGIEASMAGFVVTAIVYPMLNVHWFFTTVALNLAIHARVFSDLRRPGVARQRWIRSSARPGPDHLPRPGP